MKLIQVENIQIAVEKLKKYSHLAFNREGKNFTHRWEHYSGLGFLSPRSGLAHSEEDCIEQSRLAQK